MQNESARSHFKNIGFCRSSAKTVSPIYGVEYYFLSPHVPTTTTTYHIRLISSAIVIFDTATAARRLRIWLVKDCALSYSGSAWLSTFLTWLHIPDHDLPIHGERVFGWPQRDWVAVWQWTAKPILGYHLRRRYYYCRQRRCRVQQQRGGRVRDDGYRWRQAGAVSSLLFWMSEKSILFSFSEPFISMSTKIFYHEAVGVSRGPIGTVRPNTAHSAGESISLTLPRLRYRLPPINIQRYRWKNKIKRSLPFGLCWLCLLAMKVLWSYELKLMCQYRM